MHFIRNPPALTTDNCAVQILDHLRQFFGPYRPSVAANIPEDESQALVKILSAENAMIEEVIPYLRSQMERIAEAQGATWSPEDIQKVMTIYANTMDLDMSKACLQYVHKMLLSLTGSKCIEPAIALLQELADRIGSLLKAVSADSMEVD